MPPYPAWLNRDFEARLDLPSRWQYIHNEPAKVHLVRPEAYESLLIPFWPYRFETCDAGVTTVACEVRHPFFDVRLLGYLLAIPPIPWCVEKDILRMAMRGMLPEQVRRRPKTPLAGDPFTEYLRNCDGRWWNDRFDPCSMLRGYVENEAVVHGAGVDSYTQWVNMRPLSLNYWLKQTIVLDQIKLNKEDCYGITIEGIEEETLS